MFHVSVHVLESRSLVNTMFVSNSDKTGVIHGQEIPTISNHLISFMFALWSPYSLIFYFIRYFANFLFQWCCFVYHLEKAVCKRFRESDLTSGLCLTYPNFFFFVPHIYW